MAGNVPWWIEARGLPDPDEPRSMGLSAVERADLLDALQAAAEDLSERAHGKYSDYEPEDMPEIDAQLDRWNDLIGRLVAESSGGRARSQPDPGRLPYDPDDDSTKTPERGYR